MKRSPLQVVLWVRIRFAPLFLFMSELGRFPGCMVPEGTMRTDLIVVDPPGFDLVLFSIDQKPMLVQILLAQPSIKRLDVRVVCGLARSTEPLLSVWWKPIVLLTVLCRSDVP